ncbi:MAG: Gfo/Idh/MocA family protein [Limisphaerales bacterium]
MKTASLSRRAFLRRTTTALGAAAAFPYVASPRVLGANGRLRIASVGVGGKGWTDLTSVDSEDIVGVCDVDAKRLAKATEKYPQAKGFADWRVMFDQLGRGIDAVTVSTPDHTHFHPSLRAVREGWHVYCQKPLTHTIWEARTLAAAARRAGVATQMGNQGLSHPKLRRDAELVRAGVLGEVREIHIWSDRPGKWWAQGVNRPPDRPPVPAELSWDLWLGPAPARPFHPAWGHFAWRGWWDFGTGAIGDMGCHLLNLVTLSLDLEAPVRVDAHGEGATSETGPRSATIRWEWKGRAGRDGLRMFWHDGGRLPDRALFPSAKFPDNGCLLVGTRDSFLQAYPGGGVLQSGRTYEDFKSIPETFPRTGTWDRNHYEEWITAAKGGPRALSNFDVAGPVTETVLLGQLALRAGLPIEWDASRLRVTNAPEANRFVRTEYRKGWEIDA